MSMTFDEYIQKRVNQAVEEAVHKVSVDFANNIWNHGVHDLEKIAYFSELPLEEVKELFADRIASTTE